VPSTRTDAEETRWTSARTPHSGGEQALPVDPVVLAVGPQVGRDREILCVSQFTLYGDTRKGTRPSYVRAAPGEQAEPLYDRFCESARAKKGVFGACMGVALVNDGPVTVMLEA